MNVFMIGMLPRKKIARREALMSAAAELFSAQGFDAVTVSDIARAADLATGTVYNYFPTKTALLMAILSADLATMLEQIGREEASPIDALLSVFRVVDHRSRALWRQVVGQAMLDPAGFGRAYAEVDVRLKAEVAAALGRFGPHLPSGDDQRALGDLVFNIGNALFYEYIADEALTLDAVRARFIAQLRLVFTGIGTGAP